MVEEESRRELADFLKKRRARLPPTDFGFPSGNRRRTLGLRREEVAALAGVGLTWYTNLEQGKDIRVSTAFLENLARALRFTAAERAHLCALAHHRRAMRDWEAGARGLVAKFRMNFGQAADAADFSWLIQALNSTSADFRRIWADHDVSDLGEGVTQFSSPRHGEMRFQHYILMPEFLPDLRIVAYIPDGHATMGQ